MDKYKILVVDIDGTVTNSEKNVTQKTFDAIMRIQKEGKKFVIASGRPTAGTNCVANTLKLSEFGGYVLSFNGAKITNKKTNKVIFDNSLPANIIKDIYKDAIANGVGIMTYKNDKIISGTPIDKYQQLEANINNMEIEYVENFENFVDFSSNKCLLTAEPNIAEKVEKLLAKKYTNSLSIFRSEPFFVEIMPQNIDKAFSLSKLLEHLSLSKEQMICIGDGFNDISMIKYAGLGVAMQNAQEIVKNAADFITMSNDEDGVAYVIEKFM